MVSKRDIILPVKNNQKIEIKIKKPSYEVSAPVRYGENIGRADIYADNKLLFTEALVSKQAVQKKNNFKINLEKIKNLLVKY